MVKGVDKAERRARRPKTRSTMVKLPGYGARRPGQLSGGQRQRVALARALVNRPKVLLLDEPLGALDLKLREQMQEELKALQKALGITFVFVTHDQGEALSMADRVAVFNDGRVMQVGTPEEIYQRPQSRFVADFVGSSNVLPPDFVDAHRAASAAGRACGPKRSTSSAAGGRRRRSPARCSRAAISAPTTRLGIDLDGTAHQRAGARRPTTLPAEGETVRIGFCQGRLHLMEDGG